MENINKKYYIMEIFESVVKNENFVEYLEPRFDNRKSFYKKARIYKKFDEIRNKNLIYLVSYETIVAVIEDEKAIVFGWYSQTTARHINDFLYQNGFETKTKKELESNEIFIKSY